MKNNLFLIFFTCFLTLFLSTSANSVDQFNFDVTEIEILENGNKFKGLKRGKISTNDGIIIKSDNFEYDKLSNILNAKGNVVIEDTIKKYIMYAEDVTYLRNEEKIFTRGDTTAKIEPKYTIKTKNATFQKIQQVLTSYEKTTVRDKGTLIYLDEFLYNLNTYELKGKNILVITNHALPKSDKFYFSNGIVNLKNKEFIAKDTKVELHKNIFDKSENDPRIKGVSSTGKGNKTKVKKAIFTSCSKKDGCPPWSILAQEITHDKENKQILYDHAVLRIYDLPVLYFPKFFHPDPTVIRQSGFLKPQLNDSNNVGSSITIPYFGVISEDKDFTFVSTLFDKNTQMLQNEFRQSNEKSNLIIDTGFVKDYKSSEGKRKNISHLFSRYNIDLDLNNFEKSSLDFKLERTTNDTYLKIFDQYLLMNSARPKDTNSLNNQIKLKLDHENYNFDAEVATYENLQSGNSDKYQYILPSYNFNRNLTNNFLNGSIGLNSNGNNNLNNTNILTSNIVNNLSYSSNNYISNNGIKNNFNLNLKNLNSLGKNSTKYKSSPQIELMSIFELNTFLPLIKEEDKFTNFLTPKISLKFNPSDMKNHTNLDRTVNVDNIFNLNRLGLNDSFEEGKSLTVGLDYRKEKIDNINKYFELKLGTVFRDKEENFVPKKSTLNRKQSNLFGQISNNFNDNFNLNYNFSVDNDLNTFETNNVSATMILNNFSTKLDFVEFNGEMGDSNFITSSTSYQFDDSNFINFNTRRNRKIDLTEYYDLVYEYKNDCLIAGIKYKKTYYEDRDLKPAENLMFTITLFPLTTFEQKADDLVNN